MDDRSDSVDMSNPNAATSSMRLFRRGYFDFAVLESEIATVADWLEPAPLPKAPESVMGVVGIQGRMLTVLDLATLPSSESTSVTGSPKQIVALRGDEQLALAVDSVGGTVEVGTDGLQNDQQNSRLIRGVFEQSGKKISLLDVKQLFPSAIQGRERRHRRF
jgi:chemotaxis signal transduction protein